ncbi:MAG: hypothetical protein KJO16_05930 [Muriicola sp.]|nr:hypothetical protein [Muriicola sp.]NNK11516.1 hypothetical protein [Flavobacteriaceae bacterium]
MKTSHLLRILMIAISGFLFIQCTSDLEIPDPIAGPAGADGRDGVDGTDGTASCVTCHSNTTREPIFASFMTSSHASEDGAFARGGSANCAQCHGDKGYLDYIETGMVDTAGYSGVEPMNCATCHDQHSTFDFENDGPDYALRNTDAVTLVIDDATVIDFEGSSNNCITCHQPRNSYEIPSGTADYEITSKRFGPHHGPQATMLEGVMGANIAGTEAYPGVGSAAHRTGSSCVSCHMGESTDTSQGLHSWVPTDAACVTCHPNGAPDEIAGFSEDMATLQALLEANSMFDADGYYVPGTYSAKLAQAAWNYRTLLEDNSKGIHNPGYTRALLKNSIEALQE